MVVNVAVNGERKAETERKIIWKLKKIIRADDKANPDSPNEWSVF